MKKTLIATGASLVLLLGACSKDPSANDFKSQTEKFLKSNKDVKEQLGKTFTDVTCETPSSKAVNTNYTCEGTADDGSKWTFGVQITSKDGFTVQTYAPADGAPATGDTTAPGDTTSTGDTVPGVDTIAPAGTAAAVTTG
jgi:major membrane immunogen (membrane-anchored lipoprotein)